MGVPEAWRYNGEVLTLFLLDANKEYHPSDTSNHFPFLPISEVAAFLNRRQETDDNDLVRSFQTWVREQIGHNWQKPT